jgi:hypothetical protein
MRDNAIVKRVLLSAIAGPAVLVASAAAIPDVVANGDVRLGQQPVNGSLGPVVDQPFDGLRVGELAPGSLAILDGGLVIVEGAVVGAGSSGQILVDGFGSQFTPRNLVLGDGGFGSGGGTGLLRVTDGGGVSINNFTTLGDATGAVAIIEASGFGSTLEFSDVLALAPQPSALADVNLSGGARLSASAIDVGLPFVVNTGRATLNATGTGTAIDLTDGFGPLQIGTGGTVLLADGASLLGDVDIQGGSMTLAGGRVVGGSSGPALQVRQGSFGGDGTILGRFTVNPLGTLNVGPGERLEVLADLSSNDLFGTLEVNGGTLEITSGFVQAHQTANVVARGATLAADFWVNDGTFAFVGGRNELLSRPISNDPFDNRGTGLVQVAGDADLLVRGSFTNNGTVDVRPGSTATFLDDVDGAGTYIGGGDFVFLGTFSPGNSPAVVNMQGDLALDSAGTLEIELFGTSLGDFDRLEITGDATLAGELDVVLGDGFVPTLGDRFEFLDADSINGGLTYAPFTLPGGLSLDLETGGGSMSLVVVPEPATASLLAVAGLLAMRRRR